MTIAYTHRPKLIVETEIQAARWAFLNADAAEDYAAADRHYEDMDRLLDELALLPRQRPAT